MDIVRRGISNRVTAQKLHCDARASPSRSLGQSRPRPYFFAKYKLIAMDSHNTKSPSLIEGTRPLGFIDLYSWLLSAGSTDASVRSFRNGSSSSRHIQATHQLRFVSIFPYRVNFVMIPPYFFTPAVVARRRHDGFGSPVGMPRSVA